jgi:hypothetical protein
MTTKRFTAAGQGFTKASSPRRTPISSKTERRRAPGPYNATAPLNVSGAWLIQFATFRAAGQ